MTSVRELTLRDKTRGKRRSFLTLLSLPVVAGIGTTKAARAAGAVASTPAAVTSAIAAARLSGAGRFTWFGLKIYDARLWVGAQGIDPAEFARSVFALELQYARALDGAAIAQSSVSEIEKLGLGTDAQRAQWLEAMTRVFPNVNENDRLIGVNTPGSGVKFVFNERALGSIDDSKFGEAFFAIWLDARTRAPGLRQALLAGATRRNSP